MITLGITQLLTEKQDWISNKSVGLITNHTGVDENPGAKYILAM